ncbi:MAG: AAA family ATPase [Actinomycetota bacterium]
MTSSHKPGTRVIAIANQKGGVGKSTTAVSLGAALAETGHSVLLIDLDPQGNASTGLGIPHDERAANVYEVIVSEAPIESAVVETAVKGLSAVPSNIDLAGAEIELVSLFSREMRLAKALEPVLDGRYEFVLFDCPPSLGLLTVNALAAADELIVPIQCEYYALEGLGQLLRNVSLVQQNLNTRLRLTGIVMTMYDSRTKLAEQVVDEVKKYFGEQVYDTIIPRTVRLSEAPGFGEPITVYDPKSKGAETYRALAREVVKRPRPDVAAPLPQDLPEVIAPPNGRERPAPSPEPAAEPEAQVEPEPAPEPVPETEPEEPEAVATPEPEATAPADSSAEEAASNEMDEAEEFFEPVEVTAPEEPERALESVVAPDESDIGSAGRDVVVDVRAVREAREREQEEQEARALESEPKRKWRLFGRGGSR